MLVVNNAATVADLITACQCVCIAGSFMFHVDHYVLQAICTKGRLLLINTSTKMTGLTLRDACSVWPRLCIRDVVHLYFFLPPGSVCIHLFLTCEHTSGCCHVLCACLAHVIFRMATYQFNMLHSPLDSVPVLHNNLSLHSRWLQLGACDTTRHASTPPCYLISSSSLNLIFWKPSSSRGKEMHKQKQHH